MAICIARLLSSNLKGVVEQNFSRSPVQSALFAAPPISISFRRACLMSSKKCLEELLSPIWVIVAPSGAAVVNPKLTNNPYDASAAPLIQKLGWSTYSTLVKKETTMLIYKSLNSLPPDYLRKISIKCSDDREWFLRSSDTDVRIPLLRTINGQKVFSFRRAKLWNSLERETKSAPSLKIFKKQLPKGL